MDHTNYDIDKFVAAIHNPPPEALEAMERDLEDREFAWMENYTPPEKKN